MLAYLRRRGAYIIDADQLSHRTLAPDGAAYAATVELFGPSIVRDDGTIDRAALGRIVFADPQALRQLEQIIHPAVFELAQRELPEITAPVVVIEAIKLLESGRLRTLCDEVWVVAADAEVQLARLMRDRQMSEADARQRMAAQSPQREKIRQADRVIYNNGTAEELFVQLDAIWAELMQHRRADADGSFQISRGQ